MSSNSESSIYTSSEYGSSGNEADSKGEEGISRNEMDEMIEKLKHICICLSLKKKSQVRAHLTNLLHQIVQPIQ